jgi:Mrp family chromosome partitioning ATPase
MNGVINYFKKYPYALVMLLIMIIWGTIDSIEAAKYAKLLEKEGVYTLATVTNIKGAKSGRWVTVTFKYKGREYQPEVRNETIPLSWIGEKIFIKFLPSKPVEAEYLDSLDVPDSLLKLPPTIWTKLP